MLKPPKPPPIHPSFKNALLWCEKSFLKSETLKKIYLIKIIFIISIFECILISLTYKEYYFYLYFLIIIIFII